MKSREHCTSPLSRHFGEDLRALGRFSEASSTLCRLRHLTTPILTSLRQHRLDMLMAGTIVSINRRRILG